MLRLDFVETPTTDSSLQAAPSKNFARRLLTVGENRVKLLMVEVQEAGEDRRQFFDQTLLHHAFRQMHIANALPRQRHGGFQVRQQRCFNGLHSKESMPGRPTREAMTIRLRKFMCNGIVSLVCLPG